MPEDPILSGLIEGAAMALERTLATGLPSLTVRIEGWRHQLVASGRLADYFDHPSRFPILAIPWWAAGDGPRDLAFHADIVASTVAGYCYVRLLDDLIDRHPAASVELLPVTALLQTEFQGRYQRHFPADSPFWEVFRTAWYASADAMVPPPNADPARLLERATSTIGAVLIPLRAVTLASGDPGRYDGWREVVLELARIEQLLDDVVDWQVDFERGLPNALLGYAARHGATTDAPAWVVREGYRWGLAQVRGRLNALDGAVHRLGSPDLAGFVARRITVVNALEGQTAPGLSQLAALAAVFDPPSA